MNDRSKAIAALGGLLLTFALVAPVHAATAPADAILPQPLRAADLAFGGAPDPNQVELGRLLFFDKILSGNQNISCGTCHHGVLGTGDGWSLGIGEGGHGLGRGRDTGSGADAVSERVPRNAPPYFNLAHVGMTSAFHDGRVEIDPSQPSGFATPAGDALPLHLVDVMAAQAMFPVTSSTEMAGHPGENAQADMAASGDLPATWEFIAAKVRAIPAYVDMFVSVYHDDPNIPVSTAADVTYVHIANAIAAWEAGDPLLLADDTPFDRYLRGRKGSLSQRARLGMRLFFGQAGCSDCHSGTLLTDMDFHSIGMPQIGPGKGDGFDGHEDFGRERVTKDPDDRYRFRTPPLRNVALTGPWGHDGAYATLEGILDQHLNCRRATASYDISQAIMPSRPDLDAIDFLVQNDPVRVAAIADSCELRAGRLDRRKKALLLEFLVQGLTSPKALQHLGAIVPETVPSGLPVAD